MLKSFFSQRLFFLKSSHLRSEPLCLSSDADKNQLVVQIKALFNNGLTINRKPRLLIEVRQEQKIAKIMGNAVKCLSSPCLS